MMGKRKCAICDRRHKGDDCEDGVNERKLIIRNSSLPPSISKFDSMTGAEALVEIKRHENNK